MPNFVEIFIQNNMLGSILSISGGTLADDLMICYHVTWKVTW